jgi:tetratricopeptide (TPR) repeat protein
MLTKENGFELPLKWTFPDANKYAFAFISLFVILIIIYSNSFQGAFQFDDIPNIVENKKIFLTTLDWSDISKSFYGVESNTINRPLAFFSFALNYYIDGLNVTGYHIVNFVIHYLTSVFLFLFIYHTLNLPKLQERYGKISYSISLLATVFWTTSPLQVTAITYIVQRMASMAGLFYIMAMYFYLKGRTANNRTNRLIYFGLTLITTLLSLGTKENAIMIPVSIWLFDLLMIQGVTRKNLINNFKVFIPMLLVATAIGLWYVDISSILSGAAFNNRPFTLTERLLTEPRVIIFYITLLFYPISSRLTLLHDIELSKSLLTPWTTLPAIAGIAMLLILAGYLSRKRPLIAFCIFFYFLNHVLEGSFIPLELIYEHRNYIPSMFFFVPVAIIILHVIDYFSYKKSIQFLLVAIFTFLLAAQGHTVLVRNTLFSDPLLLWADNIKKSPNLSRPHGWLGSYFAARGNWIAAMDQFSLALSLESYIRPKTEPIVHNINLARGYLHLRQEDRVIQYKKFLEMKKETIDADAANIFAIALVNTGKVEESFIMAQKALSLNPNNEYYLSNMAFIFLKMGKLDKAIETARKTLLLNPDFGPPLAILGEAYLLEEHYRMAIDVLNRFTAQHSEDIPTICALIELYDKTQQQDLLFTSVYKLLQITSDKGLDKYLGDITNHPFRYAHVINQKSLYRTIRKVIRKTDASLPH